MPTIDVPAPALNAVLDTVARYVPDREIRVMGSRTSGRAKPFSDLDLVVMGDEPVGLRTLGELRDAFDESDLPFAVDIVEWASASDAFRRIIEAQAQPLSRGGATAAVPPRVETVPDPASRPAEP